MFLSNFQMSRFFPLDALKSLQTLPLNIGSLPALNQAAAAGSVAAVTFIVFDYICGSTKEGAEKKIAHFVHRTAEVAVVSTGATTVAAIVSQKWLLLSIAVGAICSGLSLVEKLKNSAYRSTLNTTSDTLNYIGIIINYIAVSCLFYQQPSGPRAFQWAAITLSCMLPLKFHLRRSLQNSG